ncbi:anti-phage dCTP deaminase [Agrobacterium rosae]|uniref:Anti-phage dCTP deaminase n=1 Tax=Agrobacterium rosae TaxID=1972867 RepID=A0AAW9FDC8_9HYPH|nr:anti-phage dCTP deaminase [Agrobacterium rosae]MDX8303465.1 anti-phage dCTP deaminase [Agrobacterium rosae]POO53162.1 deoxycytidylate deaminase [Agrobacterium rosae]
MTDHLQNYPELVIGLVGPIGVDLEQVQNESIEQLKALGYKCVPVRVTELMRSVKTDVDIEDASFEKKYLSLIKFADRVCEIAKSRHALAALTIAAIRAHRASITGSEKTPALKHAYIIRQFKRPEEIELMRKTYGRKFIQISVYASEKDRRENLIKIIRSYNEAFVTKEDAEKSSINLIKIDHDEVDGDYGQRVSKVFHLGDVFVDGIRKDDIKLQIERFFTALFGHNGVSPNKVEYGLYIAAAASLRSVDLSRQVGAAIFSADGEILSMGCNEVPKAFGGTYWSQDERPMFRDFELGSDANQLRKLQVLHDLVDRMSRAGFFCDEVKDKGDAVSQLRFLLENDLIKDSKVMDIIEYGRIIHAEMSAITDAARTGRAIKGSILYCTTFPCHMCAKHIVASGVKQVVFLEPYPKSYASDLHSDSITYDAIEAEKKVIFSPFLGISPRRYRDIFEKKGRKDNNGRKKDWYLGEPVPMIEDLTTSYVENEDSAIIILAKLL